MSPRRATLALLALLAAGNAPAQEVVWTDHTLRTLDGVAHEIELGKLQVPESRAGLSSPNITIAFLRLKSTSPTPGSPIVFLMGGPGVAASVMAPIPPYWALFDSLRTVADVILLDQRGLGHSTPSLTCPGNRPPPTSFLTSRAAFAGAYRTVVERCAKDFFGKGVAPRALTDDAIADDVDAIRVALGQERVSLLAFSYGTRIAMSFARRHGDRLDRLVLQGPTDGQLMYRGSAPYDTLLARIAREAAADSATASFAADLVPRTRALLKRTTAQPITVRIAFPEMRVDSFAVNVGGEVLAGFISGRLGDARLPALIATLEVEDLTILRQLVSTTFVDLFNGAGTLMARALPCSETPSDARTAQVDLADIGTVFGPAFDNFIVAPAFCSALGEAPKRESEPRRRIRRPALLIVGDRDDRTPPSNATQLQREMSDAVRLVVKNGGHELLPVPEVQRTVIDFFRGADVRGRALSLPVPRYLSIDEAKLPPRRPGA